MSLERAIVAYTAASAYLVHDDVRRGSLAVGKIADIVVVDRNLFETPPLEIHNARIDMTLLGGRIVFERTSQDQ